MLERQNEGENISEASSIAAAGSGVVEETDPDLLKNTPSNIRRLADEIQQFEGRQKYLAQTRSSSDGGDVRWYFCKVPLGFNQLAASIPHAEVVGKGEYFRFGMRDSLAIEASFLQREEELLSYWWREYAECSEGPKGRTSLSTEADVPQNPQTSELYVVEEERVGVPVKGGLYEVDLVKRHSFPVYWNGENRRVLRGHWFAQSGGLDWLPLREDVAEQLEFAYRRQVWHRRTFQPSGLFAARVDLHGYTPGLHALFTGEDDTWEAWLNVDASGFSTIIKFGGKGVKLRRGYAPSPSPKPTQDELRQQKEEEMDDYCSEVPVRHLVFMVHGIGQRLEKSNLVDDVTTFRHITSSLAEKHLTSYQRGTQRVLFIPCQWRKGLKLSGESAVEKITLDGVRGLRTTLSATVHDVLYYMSPIYCQEIIDSVSNQLNRLYVKFLKRNPGYDGKVSLYGHSLGSVLSYDILCHQENLSSPFPMEFLYTKDGKDESSGDACKSSSDFNSKDDGIVTPQETLNDDKTGGHLDPPRLGDLETENSPLVKDLCPAPCFNIDESSIAEDVRGMQDGTESFAANVQDQDCSPSDVCPVGILTLGKATDINCCDSNEHSEAKTHMGVVGSDVKENLTESLNTSDSCDKDEDIQALKSELDALKARLAYLETQLYQNDASGRSSEGCHEPPSISDQDASRKTIIMQDDRSRGYKPYIKYTKLEFKVDTFFAVGSPLGVFLSIRNVRIGIGEGQEYWGEENICEEMPACLQMFNIFHPFDPVAYRIEPLVCREYVERRPVIVPYHRGGKRLHIGLQEFAEDVAARSQSVVKNLNVVKVQVLTLCQSRRKDDLEVGDDDVTEEEKSYGSYMMERLTGSEDGRIDHVLQDKTFQHSYISAIGAHTNYWRDYDTALFILKHLYRDIPEDPAQLNSQRCYTKDKTETVTFVDEELPLTFSSNNISKRPPKRT
ncbi:phospholipase SGR2 [Amaranthus tricolor]|uniref:phospholipase SGR2 n=1 Tax=Amaranthus tricolor TaxID=29722 RepID=UPI00258BB8B2|nr:phospholipase SGR2 [Amaranthus tricolor]